jgi:hypothetical protein
MQMRKEEELWGDFRDVVATLYQDPAVVSKMETKLKRGFLEAATRSCAALKSWLNQFVKAGRLSLRHMEGNKQLFSAAWCTFLMLLPGDALPEEEFEQRASEVRVLFFCLLLLLCCRG